MNKEILLEELGLTDKEAKTYLAILELGSSTIKPIADKAGLKRTSIYNFIDHLIELGLVTRTTPSGTAYYQAISPQRLLELQKERLNKLEQQLPEFMGLFNTLGAKPRISYYEGPEQIKNIMRNEPNCKEEACYVWPGQDVMEMIGGTRFMSGIDKERIKNKVRVRAIRFRDKDITFDTSSQRPEYLRDLRFAPPTFTTTMCLAIYDTGKVCFISSDREGFGIVLESKELEILAKGLFELLWMQSEPAKLGEG